MNSKSPLIHLAILLLTLAATPAFAQNDTVPSKLVVPEGSKLLLHAYAKGVQIYLCTQVPTDTARYTWTFVEPRASLYSKDNYKVQVGKHYYNPEHQPVWEDTDGSIITGARLETAPAPDSANLPWLLLKAVSTSGFGPLSATAFIQRIHTKGGKPPAVGADRDHKGQFIRVGYTAEYLFYKNVQ